MKIAYVHDVDFSNEDFLFKELSSNLDLDYVEVSTDPYRAVDELIELDSKYDVIISTGLVAAYSQLTPSATKIMINPALNLPKDARAMFPSSSIINASGAVEELTSDFFEELYGVGSALYGSVDANKKQLVWGVFGTLSKTYNHIQDFRTYFRGNHLSCPVGYHLVQDKFSTIIDSDDASYYVVPLIKEILYKIPSEKAELMRAKE